MFVEHVGQSEVLEGIVQLVGRLDLELGHVNVELGRRTELEAGKVESGQSRLRFSETFLRQDENHGEAIALVRHLEGPGVDVLEVGGSELGGHVHHVGLDGAAVGQVEGALSGVFGLELLGPVAFEVNGIDQDQPEN